MRIFILLCIAFDVLGIIIYRHNPFVIATCTFAMACGMEDELEERYGLGRCFGEKRFLIVAQEPCDFTYEELNSNYAKELVAKYKPQC